MFAVIRASLRAFAIGVVVGLLVAPRTGNESRKLLSARVSSVLSALGLAGVSPIEPERLRTNGHSERPAPKRSRSRANARTP